MPPWPGSITINGRESVTATGGNAAVVTAGMAAVVDSEIAGFSSGRLSGASDCTKLVRSTSSKSSTSRGGWPLAASST